MENRKEKKTEIEGNKALKSREVKQQNNMKKEKTTNQKEKNISTKKKTKNEQETKLKENYNIATMLNTITKQI